MQSQSHIMIRYARGLIYAIITYFEKSHITAYITEEYKVPCLHISQLVFSLKACDLLPEFPTILDSFFTSATSNYIGVVGCGW